MMFREIYDKCNIISLHVPLNDKTEHMINRDVLFNQLKSRPLIINTSRGKLIDSDSLIDALKDKKISGYLADVLAEEPITSGEKLVGLDNVIINPSCWL